MAPRKANQELFDRLQQLQKLKLESEEIQPGETKTAVKYAEDILSSGATLCEASIAGGSELGDSRNGANMDNVTSWLSDLHALRQNKPSTDIPAIRTVTSPEHVPHQEKRTIVPEVASTVGGVRLDDAVFNDDEGDAEEDWDDDLNIELTQAVLVAGTEAFTAGNYETAQTALREALSLIRELPMEQQSSICDLRVLQYQLASCTYFLNGPAAAEPVLLSLVQELPQSSEARALQCKAAHLLSQVCVATGRLEQARQSCESALRARRKLLGKEDDDTCKSLALLARIQELQGNDARAQAYRSLIPEASRKDSIEIFVKLKLVPTDAVEELSLDKFEEEAYHEIMRLATSSSEQAPERTIAVKFLQSSGLSEESIGQIWQLADPGNIGNLDRARFFVAMRLVAHTQAGRRPNAALIRKPAPLPWFSKTDPPLTSYSPLAGDGAAKFRSLRKLQRQCWPGRTRSQLWDPACAGVPYLTGIIACAYANLFQEANPQTGLLARASAWSVLTRSQLPSETLHTIWALVTPTTKEAVNQTEFVVAIHLTKSMQLSRVESLPDNIPWTYFDEITSLIWRLFPPKGNWASRISALTLDSVFEGRKRAASTSTITTTKGNQ